MEAAGRLVAGLLWNAGVYSAFGSGWAAFLRGFPYTPQEVTMVVGAEVETVKRILMRCPQIMFPNGWLGGMPAVSIFVLVDPQQELGASECLVRIDMAFQSTRTMPIILPQGTEQIMYHRSEDPITVLDAFQQFRSDLLAHFLSNDEIIRRRLLFMLSKHLPSIQVCCEILNRDERKFFCRSVTIVNRTAGCRACRILGIPESEIEEELQNLQVIPFVPSHTF